MPPGIYYVPPPQPQVGPKLVQGEPDAPPLRRFAAVLALVLAAWQPGPVTPIWAQQIVQEAPAVAEQVPARRSFVSTFAWHTPTVVSLDLPVGVPAPVTLDAPPVGRRKLGSTLAWFEPPPPTPVRYARFIFEGAAPVIDAPPGGRLKLGATYAWFSPAVGHLWTEQLVQEFVADSPLADQRRAAIRAALRAAWEPGPLPPTVNRARVTEGVAPVTPDTVLDGLRREYMAIVAMAWEPLPGLPTVARPGVPQPGVAVDTVLDGLRAEHLALIVAAWQPIVPIHRFPVRLVPPDEVPPVGGVERQWRRKQLWHRSSS